MAALSLGLLSFAPGASASARYGPPHSQFSISFPSAPKSSVNDPKISQGLPKGGHAYAYWVSSTSNLFGSSAPLPPTPSYIIIEAVMPTTADANGEMTLVKSIVKTKFSVGGASGYGFLGPENSKINEGQKITDRHATEGFVALQKGKTVFLVYAFTSARSAAWSFLSSFKAY